MRTAFLIAHDLTSPQTRELRAVRVSVDGGGFPTIAAASIDEVEIAIQLNVDADSDDDTVDVFAMDTAAARAAWKVGWDLEIVAGFVEAPRPAPPCKPRPVSSRVRERH